jgi:antibiotic biosynthesis monooxygenase (ABM) superfamily enzyme
MLVVMTNCVDQSREEEFNRWYDDVHVPEMLTLPGYVSARRLRVTDDEGGSAFRYLILFEVETDDPIASYQDMRRRARDMDLTPLLDRGPDRFFSHMYSELRQSGGG